MAAAEIRNTYEDYQKTIIYKPSCDPVKGINTEGCLYKGATPTHKTKGFNPCSCVAYAKYITGFTTPIGLAKYWPVDSTVPSVGAVVVFSTSYTGHVAIVIALNETTFRIKEYNWNRCQYSEREIKYTDPSIIGFDE